MKKILFISQTLPPYLYPQSIQIGRFLNVLKKKYDTYILTAEETGVPDPTLYPDFYDGIAPEHILKVTYKKNIHWARIQTRLLSFFYRRPDLQRNWADKAYAACLRTFPDVKFDCIVTFSFPLSLNLLGRRLKKHYGCSWLAHQSDPWADNPFMRYDPINRVLNQVMERQAFTDADKLVFTCTEAADFYRKKYPAFHDKIDAINHSYNRDSYPEGYTAPQGKKIIRYIGSFYGERTAKPFLTALKNISSAARDNLRFEIVGASLKTRLLLMQAGLPEGLVDFIGRVNYGQSLQLMQESDALIVIDAPLEKDNIFFPSKLADYIGSGRPIIGLSSPGPTQRILQSLGYRSLDFDQADALTATLEKVAAGQYPALQIPAAQAESYVDTANADRLRGIIDAL